MTAEEQAIYDDLRSITINVGGKERPKYGLTIDKKQYAEIIGASVSTINNYISKGYGVPDYQKLGNAKNSKVLFTLRNVAKYLASQTVKTA